MNTIVIATIAIALFLVLILLVWVLMIITGRYRFTPVKKEGNIKQYVIGVILFLLVALVGCSPKAYLSNGCGYKVYAPKFKA